MTGTTDKPLSVVGAREAWLEHRHFRYRGCAPHPDNPQRMAGNPELPLGAHHAPDVDGGEGQKERRAREDAAIEVCLGCPVMVACDVYANSVTPEGKLAEPDGVWGGRTGLERHKALIKARHAAPAAPDRRFETPQKQAVLKALASFWDPYDVAAWAGVDVRTANWQRSSLVRLLGLPKDVSRMRALAVARERGLLDGVEVRPDDGSVPAVPPPTRMPAPGPVLEETPGPCRSVPDAGPGRAEPPASRAEDGPYEPTRVPSPRRDRFADVDGQLALWEAELTDLAEVHDLFPTSNERLETAA
jgi:hypothetical protein